MPNSKPKKQFMARHTDGTLSGPFLPDQLRSLAMSGGIKRADEIQLVGKQSWHRADSVEGLFPPMSPHSASSYTVEEIRPARSEKPNLNDYYYTLNGESVGPVPYSVLQQMVQMGQLDASSQIRNSGSNEWLCVAKMPDLKSIAVDFSDKKHTKFWYKTRVIVAVTTIIFMAAYILDSQESGIQLVDEKPVTDGDPVLEKSPQITTEQQKRPATNEDTVPVTMDPVASFDTFVNCIKTQLVSDPYFMEIDDESPKHNTIFAYESHDVVRSNSLRNPYTGIIQFQMRHMISEGIVSTQWNWNGTAWTPDTFSVDISSGYFGIDQGLYDVFNLKFKAYFSHLDLDECD